LQLPISENLQDNSIVIPLYIPMSTEEINEVVSKLTFYLAE
jgi:dTDP-4-amino-4,6-dideoxygalactose transaminase